MLAPDGKPVVPAPRDSVPAEASVVRALARAIRWRKMIETGDHATVREIADAEGVKGKATTPFLLQRIFELTGGKSLESNIALVKNNAKVAAQIAVALSAQLASRPA